MYRSFSPFGSLDLGAQGGHRRVLLFKIKTDRVTHVVMLSSLVNRDTFKIEF